MLKLFSGVDTVLRMPAGRIPVFVGKVKPANKS